MKFPPLAEQMDLIRKGAVEIISEEDLERKISRSLANGKPLLVKTGFDPTAPDLHLGHTVLIRKMKHFQDLGHRVVFLIGDFTGLIGDPTGRNKARLPLSQEQIKENAQTYREQIFKLLDPETTVIDFNSRWLNALTPVEFVKLTASYTVAQMLERDDFSNRFKKGEPIFIHELLYPLMQGYDSIELRADIELGGTDQKFNLLVGRELQKSNGQEPQVILTMPLLEGLDGVQKMSKSLQNHVGISDPPGNMFGKIMSIPDELMFRYYELLTDMPSERIAKMKADCRNGDLHPMDLKMRLARSIIDDFHSPEASLQAETEFIRVFRQKEIPDQLDEIHLSKDMPLIDFLIEYQILSSRGEAKRTFGQGGIYLDHQRPESLNRILEKKKSYLLKIGKRKFFKIN